VPVFFHSPPVEFNRVSPDCERNIPLAD